MAFIGLSYNFPSVTGTVIGVVYAHTNPAAEIDDFRWEMDGSAEKPKTGKHTITGTRPGIFYTVKFFQSSDGTTLETDLQCDVMADGAIQTVAILERYEYVVGGGRSETNPDTDELIWKDPEAEDDELHDTRLAGMVPGAAFVHLQGFGDFLSYQITWLEDGGFSFVDGKKFGEEEKYVVWKKEIVQHELPAPEFTTDLVLRPLVDADFEDGVVNFGPEFYGKRSPVNFSGQKCKMVFGNFALIPDTIWEFNTYQGSQIYFELQFFSGNTVPFNGANKNVLHFPKMEWCRLEWNSGVCYVTGYTGRAHMRGQIIGDTQDRSILNAGPYLSCVETGSPLDGIVYSGIYEWLTSLPNGYAVSMADWPTNKRHWGLDTINKTFRPPMVENMHRRFRNGAGIPGSYIADDNKKHRHYTVGDEAINTNLPGVDSNTSIARDNELNGNLSYRLKKSALEPTLGRTSESGGDEVTVKAYIEIPLVIL